jgi:2-phosphosulfolactate phosphatase
MKIDIFGSYQTVQDADLKDRDVVVLDIYRTTSVIVTALAHGARRVIPAGSIEEAWEIYNRARECSTLLGGERNARPIEGFHFDNSPASYTVEKVRGMDLVVTTSNGTGAIKKSLAGKVVYIASFFNVSAVSEELKTRGNDVVLVCAGTFGRFALEDGLCAGMIALLLSKKGETSFGDLAAAMSSLYESSPDIRNLLQKGSVAYTYLEREGYEKDIDLCLQADKYDVMPRYCEGCVSL